MTKDEALRLALEALEYFSDTSPNMAGQAHAEDAITAIKAALEAPQRPWQELMRGVRVEGDTVVIAVKGGNDEARELCGALLMEKNT